ncbi:MAG: phosphoenolpyruvate mutase [Ignavibacteriales bacterium]|nr:phosphoenolpyruvate mutase [Ignavibacteriales bacterium]
MKKTTQLKNMLISPELEFIMEAHNGLSAKIVEETGFKGIWASGLSISAALGVRDNNEASWTQVLEVCEFMSDATNIPILLDGDTGFGNFNSFRRLVRKLEDRRIAGVCIEDKIFPKTNSFISGEKQPLAEIDEFCGKIKAGKDTQLDPDFSIVARVEAFIAGWGIDEVMKRANAYADAGADAILIHSKIADESDIEAFMKRWDNSKPIVIVPTMYYNTPVQKFKDMGISLIIWANHTLRASITNMQKILEIIYTENSLASIEKKVVPVKEIFRLQNMQEYKKAEEAYLPQKKSYKGIILAASKGQNFGSLTDNKPKAMIQIDEDTILSKIVKTFNAQQIKEISVVVGYKKEAVNLPNLKYISNDHFDENGILYSLYLAKDELKGDIIISFGDILFEEDILNRLMLSNEDILLAVDARKIKDMKIDKDLVIGEQKYSNEFHARNICKILDIQKVESLAEAKKYNGEFIGLMKLSSKGADVFQKEFEYLEKNDSDFIKQKSLNEFIKYLINKKYDVKQLSFKGHWRDIDSIEDLTYIVKLFQGENHQ